MYRKVGDNDELKLENLNHEPVCGVWSEFCGKIFIESQSVEYVEEHEDSEVMYCKYMYYTFLSIF